MADKKTDKTTDKTPHVRQHPEYLAVKAQLDKLYGEFNSAEREWQDAQNAHVTKFSRQTIEEQAKAMLEGGEAAFTLPDIDALRHRVLVLDQAKRMAELKHRDIQVELSRRILEERRQEYVDLVTETYETAKKLVECQMKEQAFIDELAKGGVKLGHGWNQVYPYFTNQYLQNYATRIRQNLNGLQLQ